MLSGSCRQSAVLKALAKHPGVEFIGRSLALWMRAKDVVEAVSARIFLGEAMRFPMAAVALAEGRAWRCRAGLVSVGTGARIAPL
jgi:hypothetical protein